jgi:hypothetical protein
MQRDPRRLTANLGVEDRYEQLAWPMAGFAAQEDTAQVNGSVERLEPTEKR